MHDNDNTGNDQASNDQVGPAMSQDYFVPTDPMDDLQCDSCQ